MSYQLINTIHKYYIDIVACQQGGVSDKPHSHKFITIELGKTNLLEY